MADETVRGRFVWHELMTPDSVAAYGFYGKALGWKTVNSEGDAAHTSFAATSGPVASVAHLDDGAPSWIPYMGTADLDQAVADATASGASVTKSITSIPGGGRYAILTDPQGAVFGMYDSDQPAPPEAAAKRGEYSWHELATTEADAAFDFYAALLGWEKLVEHDMGPMGMYLIFGRNGMQLGGIYKKMPEQPGPAWLGYVRVKDVDKTVKKVTSAGGTLINGPMDVPGGDRIAQFLDPHGAMFAIHALAMDVRPPQPAPEPENAQAEMALESPAAEASEMDVADSEEFVVDAEPVEPPAPVKKSPRKKPAAKKSAAKASMDEVAEPAMEVRTPSRKKAASKKSARKPAAKKKAASKVAAKSQRPAGKAAKAGRKGKSAKKLAKKAGSKATKKAVAKKSTKKAPGKSAKKSKKAKSARKAK